MMLRYQSDQMPSFIDLKLFRLADQNVTVNAFIDAYFWYRFEVFSVSRKKIVCNLSEFMKFGQCGFADIDIYAFDEHIEENNNLSGNCTIKWRNLNADSFVPYIYIFVFLIVIGTVIVLIIKLSFTKYRRL